MVATDLVAFFACAAALCAVGQSGMKEESIACIDAAVKEEFTKDVKPKKSDATMETSRVFIEHLLDPPKYTLEVNWGGAAYLQNRDVEGGSLTAREGDPTCLNMAHRKCIATLLQPFVPAVTVPDKETSIGKSWSQLVDAMRSAKGVKDDCSLEISADGARLRATAVQCLQKLAKGTLGIQNAKPNKPRYSERDAVWIQVWAATEGCPDRRYNIVLKSGEKNGQLFSGSTNPDVPLVPYEYTDRACEDLAIMRCANQMLHHHAKPQTLASGSYKGDTGKTWTEFLAALAKDNTFQCK